MARRYCRAVLAEVVARRFRVNWVTQYLDKLLTYNVGYGCSSECLRRFPQEAGYDWTEPIRRAISRREERD